MTVWAPRRIPRPRKVEPPPSVPLRHPKARWWLGVFLVLVSTLIGSVAQAPKVIGYVRGRPIFEIAGATAPTLNHLDGFAHQTLATSQTGSGFGGVYDAINTSSAFSFDTTNKRTAAHVCSLKLVESGSAACNLGRTINTQKLTVSSFYIRVTAAPSVNSAFFGHTGPTNQFNLAMNTSGNLLAQFATGTVQSTSGTYADGDWHRITVRVDTTGTTYTADWNVDGTDQTQATLAGQTAANQTAYRLGSSTTTHTLTIWFQDFVASVTTGDYTTLKSAGHIVLPLYPTGEGTETLGTTNAIIDEAAGNTNLYQKVDDWNGGTPDTSTYITYTSTTLGDAASNFAEFTMSNPDSAYTDIWDVILLLAGFASGTNANTANLKVLDAHGGTTIDSTGLLDYSGSTTVLGYARNLLARISGGWSNSNLSGVVLQWGFSNDTNPLPRLSAVMLEFAAASQDPVRDTGTGAVSLSGSQSTEGPVDSGTSAESSSASRSTEGPVDSGTGSASLSGSRSFEALVDAGTATEVGGGTESFEAGADTGTASAALAGSQSLEAPADAGQGSEVGGASAAFEAVADSGTEAVELDASGEENVVSGEEPQSDEGTATLAAAASGTEAVADTGSQAGTGSSSGSEFLVDAGSGAVAGSPSGSEALAATGAAATTISGSRSFEGRVDHGTGAAALAATGREFVRDTGSVGAALGASGAEFLFETSAAAVTLDPSGTGEVGGGQFGTAAFVASGSGLEAIVTTATAALVLTPTGNDFAELDAADAASTWVVGAAPATWQVRRPRR